LGGGGVSAGCTAGPVIRGTDRRTDGRTDKYSGVVGGPRAASRGVPATVYPISGVTGVL